MLAHHLELTNMTKQRGLGSPHAALDYTPRPDKGVEEESSTVPRPMNTACSSTRDSPPPQLTRLTRILAFSDGQRRYETKTAKQGIFQDLQPFT
jgi:hypothetical protein